MSFGVFQVNVELLSDQSALIKTLIDVESVSKFTAANRVKRARKSSSYLTLEKKLIPKSLFA